MVVVETQMAHIDLYLFTLEWSTLRVTTELLSDFKEAFFDLSLNSRL